MDRDVKLEVSLLVMRLSIAGFLLVWALDKVVSPDHAQEVFGHFYYLKDLPPAVLQVLGYVQTGIIAAFAIGIARTFTYGAVLLMHAISTASTYTHLIAPWGEGSQLLFWAAVPVLAAMLALFLLRDRDRMLSYSGHAK
jgi:hypothetical protein